MNYIITGGTGFIGTHLAESGYDFRYTFEEALKNWFEDNDEKGLQ